MQVKAKRRGIKLYNKMSLVSDQWEFCTEQKENTDLKVMLGYKDFTKNSSSGLNGSIQKDMPMH